MPPIPEVRVPHRPRLLRLPALDGVPPLDAAEAFRDLPGLALLESARPGRTGRWSFLSADPVAVLERAADGPDPFAEARALLSRLGGGPGTDGQDRAGAGAGTDGGPGAGAENDADAEDRAADAGPVADDGSPRDPATPPFTGGLVGYLGYDLGRRLERLPSLAAADQPLPELRLALHDWAIAWDRRSGEAWLGVRAVDGDEDRADRRAREVLERVRDARPAPRRPDREAGATTTDDPALRLVSRTSPAAWAAQVEALREAIGRGDLYQANLTRRLEAPFRGDPWPLFRRLRSGDPALFAGYLDLGPDPATGAPRALLSASPEPFLAVDGEGRVRTDPIKGTRPRGRTPGEDRALLRELLASRKDQAENVMIVDVLRNDLGRVCEPGSVRVPRLLRPERTAAVQHLVTTVTGRLAPGRDAFDLLAASFPGGSITGAPKIRAMEVVEGLEPVRRGPYCGALAWLGPDGRLGSSILIRTFVADGGRLTLHVGGGITWRSDPAAEWAETAAKARGPLRAIGAVEAGPADDAAGTPAGHPAEAASDAPATPAAGTREVHR